jgi:ABC-type dipeptide/oligopeptide/nickel transport system permease subunit
MPKAGFGAALWRAIKSFALLRESWVGMVGAFLILFWVLVALFAPLLAPFDPNSSIQPFAKPGMAATGGGTFWLGTDHIGRDILSRIIWGSRTVLIYAPLATLSAYTVGILMGLMAGYRGGWVDDVLSRLSDIILSFPVLVLYIHHHCHHRCVGHQHHHRHHLRIFSRYHAYRARTGAGSSQPGLRGRGPDPG